MSYFLRFIAWDRWAEEKDWVPEGVVPSAPLGDLKTSKNDVLSLWQIDEDLSNLDRVLAAFATKRTAIQELGYILISRENLQIYEDRMENNPSDTPDAEANRQWHVDLTRLTADDIHRIVYELYQNFEPELRLNDEVKDIIEESLENGYIELRRINSRLQDDLRRLQVIE